jgi:hypothetical protein
MCKQQRQMWLRLVRKPLILLVLSNLGQFQTELPRLILQLPGQKVAMVIQVLWEQMVQLWRVP